MLNCTEYNGVADYWGTKFEHFASNDVGNACDFQCEQQ